PAEPEPGVRDHDIQPSERVDRGRDRLAHVVVVRRVPGDDATTCLGGDLLERFGAAARDDHVRTLAREPPSGGRTDPGPAAAHDRHLALEPHLASSRWGIVCPTGADERREVDAWRTCSRFGVKTIRSWRS